MNQTFDIHRFALILKLDVAEKGRNLLLLAALLITSLLLMLLPITMSKEPSGLREALHYMALFMVMIFGTTFYSSYALTQYSAPSSCIAALMVPASKVEKFLSAMFLNFVFIIPFLFFFIKLHHVTIDIGNSMIPAGGYKYSYISDDVFAYFLYCYFILHAVVFLGSIFFTKASYIKTAVFVLIITLIAVFGNLAIANLITGYPEKIVAFPMTGWKIWDNSDMFMIRDGHTKFYQILHPDNAVFAFRVFAALLALSFWYIAYVRLREKEI
ncbi:hypothetical protein [Dyadobacter bucti]|uniref:hypothetical protein n=1 Tax=Dyadobacter bucti TaxID=2572203 RepID=UPI001109BC0C|nr:hypothetical protein [Dyadobacter bucti]